MVINRFIYAGIICFCLFLISGCFDKPAAVHQWPELSDFATEEVAKIKQARNDYCAATSDSLLKKAALLLIQTKLPGYPDNGICTGWYPALYQSNLTDNFIRAGPPEPLPA